MPFLVAPNVPVAVISAHSFLTDQARASRFQDYLDADVIRSMIDEIRVSCGVCYPLRQSLQATFLPGQGEYLVAGFSPTFIGHGDTEAQSSLDWRTAVHATVQELLHKRPFEMDEQDRQVWRILTDQIDVTAYRNRMPISIRQFGHVSKARPYPQEITWEDGSQDKVQLDMVGAPDFVTYKPGQPLEAVVERDPLTFQMLRIVHVERRRRPARLPADQERVLLEAIGSASQLEEVSWD
ncbi:MAG: hypothetical protein NTY19_26190 [Planctomycetota bacterium]|nr:hypothetical protein [Planctomycetota bacterium]